MLPKLPLNAKWKVTWRKSPLLPERLPVNSEWPSSHLPPSPVTVLRVSSWEVHLGYASQAKAIDKAHFTDEKE